MEKTPGRSRRLIIGLVSGLALLCLTAFVGVRALSETHLVGQRERVATAGAEMATVVIDMPSGLLELSGGDEALLDADFRYSDPQAKPRLDYKRRGNQGILLVEQPEQKRSGLRRAVNRWDLRLNPQIPLDLEVHAGAGAHALDLRGLSLQQVEITSAENSVMSVDLAGYWAEDVPVIFREGTGLLVINLPQGMGARVEVSDHQGEIKADGLGSLDQDGSNIYVNRSYGQSASSVHVQVAGHRGDITLRAGVPGDLPVGEAIKLAKLIYSKEGTFHCEATPDDGHYLATDMVRDLWYDYLCERGPEARTFDGDDPLTQELAAAELVDQIRREYYREERDIKGATMKFNVEEFMSATLDMLLKARRRPEHVEFSLTHFMGSFRYSVKRAGDRLHFTIENQTDLASGTHLPLRFPDGGYTHSLETLVAQKPQLADAFLLELVQSNRYPIVSVLEPKSRQDTNESLAEGGGSFRQTFTWSEPYLSDFGERPPWPDYVRQLEIR